MRNKVEVPSARHMQSAWPVHAPCLIRMKPRIIRSALVALRPAFSEGRKDKRSALKRGLTPFERKGSDPFRFAKEFLRRG